MPAPNEITVSQLARLIGTPDGPMLFDICLPEDAAEDPFTLPGATRHDAFDLPGLVYRAQAASRCVILCQKGRKLSQGAAAFLAAEGVRAEYLSGGVLGWRAMFPDWRVPLDALPEKVHGASLWVTRHRPKIDRIACPWLIRRFVDRDARFLFVAPTEVRDVADRYQATPFDVEDVALSHRGDQCTFDTLIDHFNPHHPALHRLARVVRGADINRHDLDPACAGLLAVSVGLSRQYRDDHAQLDAGLAVYDALYRWARDGYDEGHDWPTSEKGA